MKPARNLQFLKDLVGHHGDECVIWPFARNEYGYGTVKFGAKIRKAHRVMCILAHGEPPEERYNAAHSCGNGKHGCVNPRHLSWKTPSENALDTVRDGRARKAGRPFAKLTQEQVSRIRRIGYTVSRHELAKSFGVGPETIRRILNGEAWKDQKGDPTRRFPSDVRDRMKQTAKTLRDRGESLDRIASRLGVSRGSVRNYINEEVS
jgi:hypothetical protein